MGDYCKAGAAVPGDHERLQNLFLVAARVLLLCGAVGVVSIAGSPGGGNATLAIICLLLWLLGVCSLALVPAAARLPRAAMVAAAVANAVLEHLFTFSWGTSSQANRGAGAAVPGDRKRLQNHFLDVARVLLLCGAVGAVSIAGSPGGGNATLAIICLLLWLLGVCSLALVAPRPPAARPTPRSPMAANRGDGAAVPGHRERPQNIVFLDPARGFMLCGAVGVVSIAGSPGGGNATQALISLLLWLLGVCFLALVPAVARLPGAAMVAAAVASAVLAEHLSTFWGTSSQANRGDGAAVPGDRERLPNLFLDAARVLMLCGAVGVVVSIAGSPGGGNATQAFICLLAWLLGVCFLAPVPAAARLPEARNIARR